MKRVYEFTEGDIVNIKLYTTFKMNYLRMKSRLFFISVFVFYIMGLKAQDIRLSFQTGYGFYNMKSLSDFTKEAYKSLPFEAKIISNYPPYFYYQPAIKFSNDRFGIGLVYLFQTTGARISSKDYSGEYLYDSKINCYSPAIVFDAFIRDYISFRFNFFFTGRDEPFIIEIE
ncbi:MAG: hypothetical protein Q8907_04360 [Bacteroidota bacterium]|nr:hypothetical protein [Bacteroidota bacterium]